MSTSQAVLGLALAAFFSGPLIFWCPWRDPTLGLQLWAIALPYALGLVLPWLLRGKLPLAGLSRWTLFAAVVGGFLGQMTVFVAWTRQGVLSNFCDWVEQPGLWYWVVVWTLNGVLAIIPSLGAIWLIKRRADVKPAGRLP